MKPETLRVKTNQILIIAFFIVLAFGQMGRISFSDQMINIYVHEAIMVCIIVLNLGNSVMAFHHKRLLVSSLVLLAVMAVSLIIRAWQFTLFENVVGLLYLVRFSLYIFFLFALFAIPRSTLQKGIGVFALITLFFSIGQYVLYPDLRNLYYLGWDPHAHRIFGMFLDTTTAGIIFLMMLMFMYSQFCGKRSMTTAMRYTSHTAVGVIFLLMLLTYSRITYLSFFLWVFYYFRKSNIRILGIVVAVFVLLVLLLPRPDGEGVKLERVYSTSSRVQDHQEGIALFQKNPMFGVGYNRLSFVRSDNIDNAPSHSQSALSSSFLTILVTTGTIGFALFVYFLWIVYSYLDRSGQSILLAVITASFFDNVLLVNFILALLMPIIAISIRNRGNNAQ